MHQRDNDPDLFAKCRERADALADSLREFGRLKAALSQDSKIGTIDTHGETIASFRAFDHFEHMVQFEIRRTLPDIEEFHRLATRVATRLRLSEGSAVTNEFIAAVGELVEICVAESMVMAQKLTLVADIAAETTAVEQGTVTIVDGNTVRAGGTEQSQSPYNSDAFRLLDDLQTCLKRAQSAPMTWLCRLTYCAAVMAAFVRLLSSFMTFVKVGKT